MRQFTYTIQDPVGIHARPAGDLVKAIKALASTVTITAPSGKSALGSRLMALMGLGIKKGDTITVTVEGDSEAQDAEVLEKFFQDNL